MNLDNALVVTLREACEHAASAEHAESLGEVQEFGERALNMLETMDRASLEPDARGVIEGAIRHSRNVQCAVHPEGGRHDAREAQQLIASLLG
jgi:hypothetical protein